jgi:hypothetical protein
MERYVIRLGFPLVLPLELRWRLVAQGYQMSKKQQKASMDSFGPWLRVTFRQLSLARHGKHIHSEFNSTKELAERSHSPQLTYYKIIIRLLLSSSLGTQGLNARP